MVAYSIHVHTILNQGYGVKFNRAGLSTGKHTWNTVNAFYQQEMSNYYGNYFLAVY